jgi:hypothetical protein
MMLLTAYYFQASTEQRESADITARDHIVSDNSDIPNEYLK